MIKLPKVLINILNKLQTIGIRPIVVGGSVRDSLLGIECKDFDIEIFSANNMQLVEEILKEFGSVKQVGKSFGVLILSTDSFDFDFTFPRTEKKIGNKHQSFQITTNPNLTYKEAAFRRDFTVNSIAYDFNEKEILDPYEGIKDIQKKQLKCINEKTFCEDSLRVYRAVQFAARFNFKIEEKTFLLCKKIVQKGELSFLAKERIYEELKKVFLKSKKPSIAFELLRNLGILENYFQELKNISWLKTMNSLDNLSNILNKNYVLNNDRKMLLFFSILCHNLLADDIKIFLLKLTNEKKFIEKVSNLVSNLFFNPNEFLEKDIKRLSLKVNIEDFYFVNFAISLDKKYETLLREAKKMNIHNCSIQRLVKGKDLISLGFKESKGFKEILDYALDLQIEENLSKNEILKIIKFNNN